MLLARGADVGVIFRRGPSRAVCLLSWHLRTNDVVEGQWLRGKIYPMRSDLSPSGRHLVYFAGKFKHEAYAWTAISRPPSLTATFLHSQNHTYHGGGLFIDDHRLWLNRIGEVDLSGQGLTYSPPAPEWDGSLGNSECLGVYLPRLRRDGWSDVSNHVDENDFSHRATFGKRVRGGVSLYQCVRASSGLHAPRGRGVYWSEYWLARSGDRQLEWPGAEWADIDRRGNLLAARDGKLLRVSLDGDAVNETLVADLNPLTFQAVPPGSPPRHVDRPSAGKA